MYVRGLLNPVERKHGWQLATQAGQETSYATQHLLGRAVWSADEVRDALRAYVVAHLGEADGVLVIDETGFLKRLLLDSRVVDLSMGSNPTFVFFSSLEALIFQ